MPRRVSLPAVVDNVPALFPPWDHRKTINLKELSELSGIATPTLRDWVRRGTIPGAFQRKKSAKWRFRREMLEPWWEELLSGVETNQQTKMNIQVLKFLPSLRATLYSGIEKLNRSDPKAVGYWEGYGDALNAIEKNLYQ